VRPADGYLASIAVPQLAGFFREVPR